MSLILNIDTATEAGSVCLSKDGKDLVFSQNGEQRDHAAWLHVAIEKLMRDAGASMQDLQAIAVSAGPGSYTGLRVGMAAAKGFCYALNIPLITENTLKIIALSAQQTLAASLICPMIDARRMEVFTALYTSDLQELIPPAAIILDEYSFKEELARQTILFTGSGSLKFRELIHSPHAFFGDPLPFLSGYLGQLSYEKFKQHQFTDIIYSEPLYIKEFHTHIKK
jgi:tRNA threonylcarbamoyladenosine biosynthesis protein TsaB